MVSENIEYFHEHYGSFTKSKFTYEIHVLWNICYAKSSAYSMYELVEGFLILLWIILILIKMCIIDLNCIQKNYINTHCKIYIKKIQ